MALILMTLFVTGMAMSSAQVHIELKKNDKEQDRLQRRSHELESETHRLEIRSAGLSEELSSLESLEALSSLDALEGFDVLETLDDESGIIHTSLIIHTDDDDTQDESAKDYQKAYNLILDEKWSEALTALESFLKAYPKSSYRDDALFWQCYAKEKSGQSLEDSFECYNNFLKRHSGSKWADDAKHNLIRIGQQLAKAGKTEYRAIVQSMEKSNDEELSLAALYALENIGDERALETTMELYDKTQNEKIRGKIVYILGEFEYPEVVTKLYDIALNDPSTGVQKKAVYALECIETEQAVTSLKKIIESNTDSEVRKAALYALGNTDFPGIVPFLRNVAINETNTTLAKTATYALGDIESPEASEALSGVLKEAKSTEAQKAAIHSLADREDAASLATLRTIALSESNPQLAKTAVYAIGDYEDDTALDVLREVLESSPHIETKKAAVYAIGDLDRNVKAKELLYNAAISHPDETIAKTAVYALEDWLDDKETDVLLDIMNKTKYSSVKKAALYEIADEGTAAVQILDRLLQEEKDAEVRKSAVYVLEDTESDEAVPILIRVVNNDPDMDVRKAAIRTLGEIGTPAAREALMTILTKSEKE